MALVFSFSNWIVKPLFGSFVLFNAEFFSVVNMENKLKLEKIINKVFLTGVGKKITKKVYL